MVAYSFNKIFVPQVEDWTKRQTVRGHRKRHARPREPVQLYTAMRTRHCRKLVDPDPVCTAVHEIRVEVGDKMLLPSSFGPGSIEGIEINGRELNPWGIETFATNDGFDPYRLIGPPAVGNVFRRCATARNFMGSFWHMMHGPGGWQGVVVYWASPDIAVCA